MARDVDGVGELVQQAVAEQLEGRWLRARRPGLGRMDGRARLALEEHGGDVVRQVRHDAGRARPEVRARIDFQGDLVQAEGRIPLVVCQGLEKRGYQVNRRTLSYDSYFARPQLIVAEPDGFLHGASDPRKDGGTPLDTETA